MAFDSFLWFQSRDKNYLPKGETTDIQFQTYNAFEIKSFNFSVQNNVKIGSQSMGAGAGKCVLEKFKFQKSIDSGSAALFASCAAGKHLDAAVLVLRKAGGAAPTASQPCYLVFKFLFCYIDTVSWSGSSGDDIPAEDISFAYGSMQIIYRMQDAKGNLTESYINQWSQVSNKSKFEVSTTADGGGIAGSDIKVPSGVPASS
jgi:type VI secretion system secreted protein Hcp